MFKNILPDSCSHFLIMVMYIIIVILMYEFTTI